MKEIWDILKNFAVAFGSGVLAYFEPVFNPMVLLSILAGVDIFWGLVSAVRIKKEGFKFKKFVRAGIYYLIYLSIIAFIYIIGYFQDDTPEALVLAKAVTYFFIYHYGVNILKNLARIFPESKVIAGLYFIFGFEFAKRHSWVDAYNKHLESKKNQEKINDET